MIKLEHTAQCVHPHTAACVGGCRGPWVVRLRQHEAQRACLSRVECQTRQGRPWPAHVHVHGHYAHGHIHRTCCLPPPPVQLQTGVAIGLCAVLPPTLIIPLMLKPEAAPATAAGYGAVVLAGIACSALTSLFVDGSNRRAFLRAKRVELGAALLRPSGGRSEGPSPCAQGDKSKQE